MIKIKIFKNYSLRYNYNETFFAIFKNIVLAAKVREGREHIVYCVYNFCFQVN